MRFSHFEQWMFRLGAAAAVVTLAAMAVRARIAAAPSDFGHAPPPSLLIDTSVRDSDAALISGSIPHVYAGQPMSPAWANQLVDSVNRADVRLGKLETRTTTGLCAGLQVVRVGDTVLCSVPGGDNAAATTRTWSVGSGTGITMR